MSWACLKCNEKVADSSFCKCGVQHINPPDPRAIFGCSVSVARYNMVMGNRTGGLVDPKGPTTARPLMRTGERIVRRTITQAEIDLIEHCLETQGYGGSPDVGMHRYSLVEAIKKERNEK